MMEPLNCSEFRIVVLGEIISAEGFKCSCPISVQFFFELPKGQLINFHNSWTKEESQENQYGGTTHSSTINKNGFAHFSHPFSNQFEFVAPVELYGSTGGGSCYPRPTLLLSVVGMDGKLLRDEGYAAEPIPSTPGNYFLNLRTWKPAARNISDKMKDLFIGVAPSIQDPRPLLTTNEAQESHRMTLFGLETEPSGTLRIRLRVMHQSEQGSGEGRHLDQLLLLEKMNSSAGILRSVQAVIEAFQRARRQAIAGKIN